MVEAITVIKLHEDKKHENPIINTYMYTFKKSTHTFTNILLTNCHAHVQSSEEIER